MANRHLSRSVALQTLFEWDFAVGKEVKEDVNLVLKRNIEEFAPGLEDSEFMSALIDSVIKKQSIIDEIIEKAAPEWPINKISVVDRNILRIGLAELLFGNRGEVPPKVAINEAIELAKSFGGENSSKFVNGVLGAVYKEMGEPGKDEVSKKKKKMVDEGPIDVSKLPIEKKGGAVIYCKHEGQILFGLVHDVFGYWTLSKGGIEDGIAEEEGTIREIKEELGIDIVIKTKLGESEYIAKHPEKGRVRKQVSFFLGETDFCDLKIQKEGGLNDVKWFTLAELADIKTYDDVLPLLAKSIEFVTKEK